MACFEDLSPYRYRPLLGRDELSVGWLDPEGPAFTVGEVAPEITDLLLAAVGDRSKWTMEMRGAHRCRFCTEPAPGTGPAGSCAEIRVKHEGVTYVAPLLIAHYVLAHGYQPPVPFLAGVRAEAWVTWADIMGDRQIWAESPEGKAELLERTQREEERKRERDLARAERLVRDSRRRSFVPSGQLQWALMTLRAEREQQRPETLTVRLEVVGASRSMEVELARGKRLDFGIEGASGKRQHGRLGYEKGKLIVFPSGVDTACNGQTMRAPRALRPGDVLRLGDVELRLAFDL